MHRKFSSMLLATAMMLPLATAGCAHRYYVDDPYYHDRHRWDSNEQAYYHQWVVENHMDAHRDYQHLSKEDQKSYWDWRHNPDRDHDHDKH